MNRLRVLIAHVVLLVLASTCFTAVTAFHDGRFQWEYFRYHSERGWGAAYPFHYSAWVVAAYLAAYAFGIAAYGLAWRTGSRLVGLAGLVLCGLGFASFAFESTHFVVNHHTSWIASAPVLLLILAPIHAIQQRRRPTAEAPT